ncbi:hypothetical protein Ddc_17928 [Ditylenchus destructor]|nr:hypothetical protein Ddc_17928 [Ditylenchus destructor]
MSSLPNDIFYHVTNFLPNDDITDLMLLSRTFNALVTSRLQKIDQEMATMDQSVKSFIPLTAPDPTDNESNVQLYLKRFEPIGCEAKKRMKKVFEKKVFDRISIPPALCNIEYWNVGRSQGKNVFGAIR